MALNESPSSFIDCPKTLQSFALCRKLSSFAVVVSVAQTRGGLSFGILRDERLYPVIGGAGVSTGFNANASLTVARSGFSMSSINFCRLG